MYMIKISNNTIALADQVDQPLLNVTCFPHKPSTSMFPSVSLLSNHFRT